MLEINQDVLTRATQGDIAAFEMIYQATSRFVYNVALRMAHHPQDAEEITQEVFLIVYEKLKNFRYESSFKTWVYRITVNYAINYMRRSSKERLREVDYDETQDQRSSPPEIREKVEQEEQQRKMEGWLQSLDPQQKACVILRSIEGLSYQQIADIMKTNINTVRSRLKRARERLGAQREVDRHETL